MIDHDALRDDVAAYALGILSAADAAAVESHLQTCDECRSEFRALAPAVDAIGYSAEAQPDSAAGPLLKARIMRAVRSEAPAQRRARFAAWPAYLAAAACLAIAVALGAQNARLKNELALAQSQSATLSADASRDRMARAREARMLADVTAADARRYPFAHGMVVTRGAHVYVAMHATAPLPPGRVYQAWTMDKGAKTVRPSITFSVASRSMTMVEIPVSAHQIAAVALSVEPAGGSPQPTTKPVAIVKLSS